MSVTLKKQDGDLFFSSSNGRPVRIAGVEKLSQDVPDALMTEYDPDRLYGSQAASLASLNSSSMSGILGSVNKGLLKSFIRDALGRLKAMQLLKSRQLDPFEAIQEIGTIRVIQFSKTSYMSFVNISPVSGPDIDPTTFLIQLRHQFLSSSKPNLPGSILTDDVSGI